MRSVLTLDWHWKETLAPPYIISAAAANKAARLGGLNPSSNPRRLPVLRGPAYYDGVEGVRVKSRVETLAP
jgi:hypothetical protein